MTHPAADLARVLLAENRQREAREVLDEALRKDPLHPDLHAELGFVHLYAAQEGRAYDLLKTSGGGLREGALARILHAHYVSLAAQTGDGEAAARAAQLAPRVADPLPAGPRVSACLIVKNEAENLPRCLASLKDAVDEIVVVDTGSTDATVEIAREAGAVLGHFAWCDDFSAARNASLDLATGDWVLWIDADEELAPGTANAFRTAVVRPQYAGYFLEILNLLEDRPGGESFVHYPVRLFRRLPGVRFTERVHEQVTPSLERLGLPFARLEGARIIHHGYKEAVVQDRNKMARTIGLLRKAVAEKPDDAFQWFNLANAYSVANEHREAALAARQAVALVGAEEFAVNLYQIYASSLNQAGDAEAALKVCDEADARGFGGILNEFERAAALQELDRLNEALAAIERCIRLPWPPGQTGDPAIAAYKRHVLRGQILRRLGRDREALATLDLALLASPGYQPALLLRGDTRQALGDHAGAIADFNLCLEGPYRAAARRGLATSARDLGRYAEAAHHYGEAWRLEPDNEAVWAAWAECLLLAGDSTGLIAAYEAFGSREALDAAHLINWGRALDAVGDPERALDCLAEAIKREPTHANAYFNAADILYRLGRFGDAAHLYEHGLRHDPENPEAWFTLGNALAQMDLTAGAVRCYDQALALDPRHDRASYNRAVVADSAPSLAA